MRTYVLASYSFALVVSGGLFTACTDDSAKISGPTSATDAIGTDCSTWCSVAIGSNAFASLVSSPDSLDFPVTLGTYTLRASAGASVTLRLDAPQEWWAELSNAPSVVVVTNGIPHRVALATLEGSGYRLSLPPGSDTVSVVIGITRLRTAPIAGDTRLVMRTVNATVLGRYAPWDGSKSKLRGSFTTSSGTTCSFDSPGTWCGIVVGLSPFVPATTWTPTGFKSQSGSGASTTISVTFSESIQSFSIDVYDPDYQGNEVVAKDGAGVTLASVPVPSDNLPGTLTIEHVTINASGIRSILLVPAPADFVAYDGPSIQDPQNTFIVECAPSPVVRGDSVTCTAVPGTSSGTVTISNWEFVGPELTAPVNLASTSLQWSGVAAASGLVSASGVVNGLTSTGSGLLTVANRNWTQDTVQYSLNNVGAGNLPSRPVRVGELGNTSHEAVILPAPGVAQVTAGPNTGVVFYTQVPARAVNVIQVNHPALTDSSAFWFQQPVHGPASKCKRVDVRPFVPVVEAHEGTLFQAMSHTFVFRSQLNALVPQLTEPIVALNDVALLDDKAVIATSAARQTALTAALDSIDGGTVPPAPYRSPTDLCKFTYFKSSTP